MEDQIKRRIQLSKEEKRIEADRATAYAILHTESQRNAREIKNARLKALRLARDYEGLRHV